MERGPRRVPQQAACSRYPQGDAHACWVRRAIGGHANDEAVAFECEPSERGRMGIFDGIGGGEGQSRKGKLNEVVCKLKS